MGMRERDRERESNRESGRETERGGRDRERVIKKELTGKEQNQNEVIKL